MASCLLRRIVGALLSVFVMSSAGLAILGLGSAAHAADGYRYWNYFHLENGSWAFSKVGAGDFTPKDGAVEGHRFGTSTTAKGIAPRADLDQVTFQAVCGSAEAAADQKRVAVLIDYGTAADADGATPPDPRADCAVVSADASGQQVLAAVADIRASKGLTCALDGYPATGCGEPVADAPKPAPEKQVAFQLPADDTNDAAAADAGASGGDTEAAADTEGGVAWPLVGAGAVVVLVAGGGVALARRNKAA
jgi:hypothetical protein